MKMKPWKKKLATRKEKINQYYTGNKKNEKLPKDIEWNQLNSTEQFNAVFGKKQDNELHWYGENRNDI